MLTFCDQLIGIEPLVYKNEDKGTFIKREFANTQIIMHIQADSSIVVSKIMAALLNMHRILGDF